MHPPGRSTAPAPRSCGLSHSAVRLLREEQRGALLGYAVHRDAAQLPGEREVLVQREGGRSAHHRYATGHLAIVCDTCMHPWHTVACRHVTHMQADPHLPVPWQRFQRMYCVDTQQQP